MSNLEEDFCHRSYTLWTKGLNGWSFNLQSLREWVCQEGEKKVVYWCIPLFLPLMPLWFLYILFFFLFSFLFYLFFFAFPPSSFTIHSYHFLYYLPQWDLPFLPLNCFWLLMGVFPRLPTSLSATQPLPLLWMCWLYHSPFLDKIACLVSYLSLFSHHPI